MWLIDLAGAALTLIALGFLALGGYLLALRLLRDEALADPLALAVATLACATAEAVAIGLLLGAGGLLRLELALGLQALLTVVLLRSLTGRTPGGSLGAPLALLGRRLGARLAEHPALAILTAHAAGSEMLRGLLRPPLAWDGLMTHLLLAGSWLQQENLQPVFGFAPTNFFGHDPGNGALWFWWWMAPSHSELYVNLASFPHWVLLGLAAGALARELGALRHWPLAAFLTLLTPTVVRFVAADYVDLQLAGHLLAALFFGVRWLRRADGGNAALAGLALGVAAGTKILGPPYCAAAALALVLVVRGDWRRRLPQLAAAVLLAAALGSFFFVRNAWLGVGPLAMACAGTGEAVDPVVGTLPALPRPGSVLSILPELLGSGRLWEAFLGTIRPQSLELGAGPQAALLLPLALVLPWILARERRRLGVLVWVQVLFHLAFWLTVPFADSGHLYANLRYLVPTFALLFAAGVSGAELRLSPKWITTLALVLAAQSLLQLHAQMPFGVRATLAVADVALVLFALSPGWRLRLRAHAGAVAAVAVLAALLLAPALAAFRTADRGRALAEELTAHQTTAFLLAPGWSWLDRSGGDGTVALISSPKSYFVYPAMGPRLERRVLAININAADHHRAGDYPSCNPRVDPDPAAWMANLRRAGVRWVYLNRAPGFELGIENRWAEERPGEFALRFSDNGNRIYEVLF